MFTINPSDATLRPLTAYSARLISGRGSGDVHRSTLFRWALRGCRGVVLETVVIGNARFTSDALVARFMQRCGESRRAYRPARPSGSGA